MKNLSFLHRIVFLANNVFAFLFLASFAIPYVSPQLFPLLSIMSLMVPLLIIVHIGFIIFWLLSGVKKQFLLSFFCVFSAILFSFFPYKFKDKNVISGGSFGVMNYNVRLFNKYKWLDNEQIPEQISDFVKQHDPAILSIQEYYPAKDVALDFPYKYEKLNGVKNPYGLGIFSKYRIINQGSLDFEKSNNNAIFIDIIKDGDTIRVYNLHLESFGIRPDNVDLNIDETRSKKLIYRLKSSFSKQQDQVEKFIQHSNQSSYKLIICGDFNNTSYSWAYQKLKANLLDTFLEAGKGFGKTYSFNNYPLRIDFILVDDRFNVNQHLNFNIELSDHEPILAKLSR